jgi:hypothetical protein
VHRYSYLDIKHKNLLFLYAGTLRGKSYIYHPIFVAKSVRLIHPRIGPGATRDRVTTLVTSSIWIGEGGRFLFMFITVKLIVIMN